MLGIPGINPVIPIWYGILGLVVAVVIHEFAHGILTRVGDMKVKAMGVVWMVIPMGAFVEPDEEEVTSAPKRKRTSMYAVGPGTNIFAAIIFLMLFFGAMSSVSPVDDSPVVVSVADGSPASMAGIPFGAQILKVDGVEVGNYSEYTSVSAPAPGSSVTITYRLNGEDHEAEATSGVILVAVAKSMPAWDAGLRVGMMVTELDGHVISNEDDLKEALKTAPIGTAVSVTALSYDDESKTWVPAADVTTITPMSKAQYYRDHYASEVEDMAYVGISHYYLGMGVNAPGTLLNRLASPFAGTSSVGDVFSKGLAFIALPFVGLQPMQGPLADLFEPTGALSWMPMDAFWVLANSMYWLFWINLMLGLTNAMPAVPLDGGFIFKDWLDSLVGRLRRNMDAKKREATVGNITLGIAFLMLFLILWQMVGPHLT